MKTDLEKLQRALILCDHLLKMKTIKSSSLDGYEKAYTEGTNTTLNCVHSMVSNFIIEINK